MDGAVEEYRRNLRAYESCAERTEDLLADLLKAESIRVHFTESRAKSPESLREKLSRPGKSYENPLVEVPDLAAVRVVLYYQDDIPKVGAIIEREFKVLETEREHQPDGYSPDQFGYLSMHYVVSVGRKRSRLVEWKDSCGIKVEIQVRTVLQHSWAAVSHALQYKREGDVPVQLRRKLFRLAGLFELADEQFVNIRQERDQVLAASRQAFQGGNRDMTVDAPVLDEFMNTSSRFKRILDEMLETSYIEFKAEDGDRSLGEVVEELERLDIQTVNDLDAVLQKDYKEFLAAIVGDADRWEMTPAFAMYLILIAAHSDVFSRDYLTAHGWHPEIATRVVQAARAYGPG